MKTGRTFFSPKPSLFSCPELGEEQKKRSSLKFSSVFSPKLGEGQKKSLCPSFLCSNPLPKLQRGRPCHNFAYYSKLIILSWQPKGGGPWPNIPPKYAPVLKDCKFGLNFLSQCVFKFKKLVSDTEFQTSFH